MAIVFETILTYLFLAALLDENSILREFWLVLCPLVGVALFLLLVPPIFTSHSLTPNGLTLRMGLLANEEIPYHSMKGVRETSVPRGVLKLGLGVKYAPIAKQMFVTSAFSNLVSIRLEEPMLVGKLWKHSVEEIIVSVTFPRELLDSLESRIGRSGGS